MTKNTSRQRAAKATVALALGALQLSALAQSLPAPPVSPAPVTNYGYDANGNPTTTTVAPGVLDYSTNNTYDNLERLKTSTDAKQGQSSFGYDGGDRTVSVSDPRKLQTQTPRTGLGDITQLSSPDTGNTGYTYDAAGNLLTRTDSRGVKASTKWDALNRPLSTTYTGTGYSSMRYSWDYDQVATGITNGVGRLTGHDYPAGNVRYGYDAQGHMIYEQYQVLAQTGINARIWKPISYGYDGTGHVTSITYPSGRVVTYSYSGGLLSTIGLKTSASASITRNLLSSIHWQPFGAADSWNWQMGSSTQAYSRVYDGYGRLVRYPLGTLVRDLTYDAGDRIQSYTHYDASTAQSQPAYDQRFGYDELGRLTSVTTNVNTWGIQYDANGNRSSFTLNGTPQTYTIDAASNKLQAIDSTRSFGYDNTGNTQNDSTSYSATYGADGRLATLAKGGQTTSYSYNTLGQRIRKTNGTTAGTTVYVYDFNSGNLLGEYDSNGNAIVEYVWMGDMPVAEFVPNPAGGVPIVYYIESDHLNTPRVVLDSSNRIRWRWLAEPFGNTAPETDPSSLGTFTFNLRFPGQYADSESGLYYNWHRYYDPSLGRYQQSDPIGLAGGSWSTYAYVSGNPLLGIDPNGLQSMDNPFTQFIPPGSVPDTPPANCPEEKCSHPVTVTFTTNNVCAAGDTMCAQAMKSAGLQGPYFPQTTTGTYSLTCLAKLGIGVKGTGAVAGSIIGKYGPGIAARGVGTVAGPVAGSYVGMAGTTIAEISSGPIGITISVAGAAAYLAKECKCEGQH